MTIYPVMLEVPDYVYERALRIAHDTARPVEVVLAQQLTASFSETLTSLPADEQAELTASETLPGSPPDEQAELAASETLPGLPADEQAELSALNNLSDAALWTIAAVQMIPLQQQRLNLLLYLNKRASLSDVEQTELDDLLDWADRLALRKAEVASILTRRGYTVKPDTFGSPRE